MENDNFDRDTWDVFLSHAREDKLTFVAPLVLALRKLGLSVWYDEIDSRLEGPSEATYKQIEAMLESVMSRSQLAVPVLSNSYFQKFWTKKELAYLLSRASEDYTVDRVFPIICGITRGQLEATFRELGHMSPISYDNMVRWSLGVDSIGRRILTSFDKRSILLMCKYRGPIDIGIFPDAGHVVIAHSGGLFKGGKIDVIDFSGKKLAHINYKRLYEALWSEFEVESEKEARLSGVMKQFEEDITYAHINHLHMRIFTVEEVEEGAAFNFGTNKNPRVIYPFYTCEPYTGGIITDSPDELTQQCLDIARGNWRGNWRRFVIKGDRFHIEGE